MKRVKFTKSTTKEIPLMKDFILEIIKVNSSLCEVHKKEEMVNAIYEGFKNRSITLFGKSYEQEKWFCDNNNSFGEKVVKTGYLSDYKNRVLFLCNFKGINNQVNDIIKTYNIVDLKKEIKLYPETNKEVLNYKDEPIVKYKLSNQK